MEGGNGLPTIKREQIVSMNQHYRRFSLDYYLECQEKLGVENIEFWLGASHFYVDSKGYEAIQPVRKKLQDHHIKVVSVFGQDLSKTELAEPVIGFLKEMLTGPHAVRKTLEKYLGQ